MGKSARMCKRPPYRHAVRLRAWRWSLAAILFLCAAPCLDADISLGDLQPPACSFLGQHGRGNAISSGFPAVGKLCGAGLKAAHFVEYGRRSESPVVLSAGAHCLPSDVSSEGISDTANLDVLGGTVSMGGRGGETQTAKRSVWSKAPAGRRWMHFEEARRAVRSLAFTRRSDFWEWCGE